MNDCVNIEVHEALPDLLHGRLNELDTATMTAHVESCAYCRAELALLREVKASAPLAPPMDAVRIASVLPPYGGKAVFANRPIAPARKSGLRYSLLAAAAVVLVALGGLSIANRQSPSDETSAVAVASTPSVSVASSNPQTAVGSVAPAPAPSVEKQPTRVATTTAPERQVASLSLVGGTQDLSEAQLETLLAELDGMESIPAAEPQSVTLSVEDIEGGQ